jgi:copper homeostasis protein
LGVARILTSGQQQNAEVGLPMLRELNQLTRGPIIMAGAGVRLTNLQKFVDIGLTELHSSAGRQVPSSMRYRKAGVTMSSDTDFDEFSRYCVDGDIVAAMKSTLQFDDEISRTA